MTRLVFGLLLGVLGAGLHRGPGETLLELPAASPALACWGPALALALAGGAVLLARRTFGERPNEALLLGAALGVLVEGLVADLRPADPGPLLPLAPVALALLVLRERRGEGAEAPPPSRPGAAPALALAGLGILLTLAPLARTVLRFGGGTAGEHALVLALFLLLAAFGGLAFGAPLRGEIDRAGTKAALAAAVALVPLVLISWLALRGQAIEPLARRDFLDRFGLDRSLEGQWHVTGIVALLGLLLPAFAVGLCVSCARLRSELAALLLGAAVGAAALALWPALPSVLVGPAALVAAGLVGGLGRTLRPSGPAYLSAWLVAALSLIPLTGLGPTPVLPWERFPKAPRLLAVGPDGQVLVRRDLQVLLDRVAIAPRPDRAGVDAEQLRVAMALAPAEPRVLLVGQLTPGRAMVLEEEGAALVDRTAAWWSSMPLLEQSLFEGHESHVPGVGQVRSLAEARSRLEAGLYDLVVVPAVVGGAPPRVPAPAAPEGTVVVAWVDGAVDLAHRVLPERVLLATDGLHHPVVGFVQGAEAPFETGAPLPPPALGTYAFERPEERWRRARVALLERLAAANGDELTAGLAKHLAVQAPSSPWAGRAERTELDHDALAHLLAAALAGEPDRLTRGVWDGLAAVLVGKRDVEGIWEWVEPVSEVWGEWFEGEVALAHADLESLEVDAAAARIVELSPPLRPAAIARWRALRRALAQGYKNEGRIEDARGVLQDLLKEDPDDREAWGLLGPDTPEDG